MRIILTHEQTDFDGIASLLGANLLDDAAIPVLPRRMNRNVRAFLTIYGSDLPFVDPRDLGDESIDSIYLVDTQSLTSVKGAHEDTRVHVIDHHAPRKECPPDWQVRLVETGANTTVFVEEIQERDLRLSIVQATLLLLGIYEDTGSLSYTRTTSRDIRAAAILVDQGANLSIVNDYINHPLSIQQQEIYDQLRAAAKNIPVHGYNILIAEGDARGMDEELSTIAHKLRDLVDPDAIFLLINIRGGVQLIARSTSDHIDVSKIAEHFGGGGHPRAAAAIIKSGERQAISRDLVDLLPEHVQPAVTVREIMSGVPHLLAPETTVQEVAKKMQRYGYEGYPVVQDDHILGLVTRRSVDRALSHRLNLTAASLMEAGQVSIAPGDSIEQLQTLMTNTGWGQVPVVDPQSKQIVGIVTRTDILETLTPSQAHSGKRNLADKLENALSQDWLHILKEIAQIAQQQNAAIYIVGGFVRDLLLGYPSLDFDLVVEGDAIQVAQSIKNKLGGRVATHKRFGTAKWFLEPSGPNSGLQEDAPTTLDFITARREFYTHPTALPTVERGSIKLDLHRRDFTINTLALRLDGHHYGELHDYWGGYNDLRHGLLRVLHSISFVDDPTRMLRAVRYEQRYGFQIGKRTLQLLLEARPLMSRVSGDRIRHELDNIINEERVVEMLDRLDEIDLLDAIHPDLGWDAWLRDKVRSLSLPSPEWGLSQDWKGLPIKRVLVYTLWFMRSPWPTAEQVVARLRLPRRLKDVIRETCQLWQELPQNTGLKPSKIATWLEKATPIGIYCLYLATDLPGARDELKAYVTQWASITPTITGHDLRERGVPPGPQYKEILSALRNAWIDGEIDTAEAENKLLKQLLQVYPPPQTQNSSTQST